MTRRPPVDPRPIGSRFVLAKGAPDINGQYHIDPRQEVMDLFTATLYTMIEADGQDVAIVSLTTRRAHATPAS